MISMLCGMHLMIMTLHEQTQSTVFAVLKEHKVTPLYHIAKCMRPMCIHVGFSLYKVFFKFF